MVWQTGADTIVGRADVAALMAAAFERLTPSLEILSVVAGDTAAAAEMVEHYRSHAYGAGQRVTAPGQTRSRGGRRYGDSFRRGQHPAPA